MKFFVEIECNNSSFNCMSEEVSRILKKLAADIERDGVPTRHKRLFDINGNDVGTAILTLYPVKTGR